jgi:hypothetical protein
MLFSWPSCGGGCCSLWMLASVSERADGIYLLVGAAGVVGDVGV